MGVACSQDNCGKIKVRILGYNFYNSINNFFMKNFYAEICVFPATG